MRLIDADIEERGLASMMVEGDTFLTAVSFATIVIRNAPTIEAIPIDWICKWQKSQIGKKYWRTTISGIAEMIEDWRKENETNTQPRLQKGWNHRQHRRYDKRLERRECYSKRKPRLKSKPHKRMKSS